MGAVVCRHFHEVIWKVLQAAEFKNLENAVISYVFTGQEQQIFDVELFMYAWREWASGPRMPLQARLFEFDRIRLMAIPLVRRLRRAAALFTTDTLTVPPILFRWTKAN